MTFTAEVDVRPPEITLPDYSTLSVEVDAIEIDDAAVDEQLEGLRARFGTLKGVDRGIENGDFVSIDLEATVDGEAVEEAPPRACPTRSVPASSSTDSTRPSSA